MTPPLDRPRWWHPSMCKRLEIHHNVGKGRAGLGRVRWGRVASWTFCPKYGSSYSTTVHTGFGSRKLGWRASQKARRRSASMRGASTGSACPASTAYASSDPGGAMPLTPHCTLSNVCGGDGCRWHA